MGAFAKNLLAFYKKNGWWYIAMSAALVFCVLVLR
jgi:hypothetical protein